MNSIGPVEINSPRIHGSILPSVHPPGAIKKKPTAMRQPLKIGDKIHGSTITSMGECSVDKFRALLGQAMETQEPPAPAPGQDGPRRSWQQRTANSAAVAAFSTGKNPKDHP